MPDLAYTLDGGVMGWIECKLVTGWYLKANRSWPHHQVAWMSRWCRLGGVAHVAIRKGADELYLVRGIDVERLEGVA